jgi:hypothetical protein
MVSAKRFFRRMACLAAVAGLAAGLLWIGDARAQPGASVEAQARQAILARARGITGEAKKKPAESRYVGQNCTGLTVASDSPFWQTVLAEYKGLPVRDCSPTGNGVKGRALVLLPKAESITRWIVSACKAAGRSGKLLASCGEALHQHVINQNGWQFIVAGLIREPAENGYGDEEKANAACRTVADREILFSFRDGITTTLQGRDRASWRESREKGCAPLPQPTDAELAEFLVTEPNSEPGSVKKYGRMAGLLKAQFIACDRAFNKSTKTSLSDSEWRAVVRDNIRSAWDFETDAMLTMVARAKFTSKDGCKF